MIEPRIEVRLRVLRQLIVWGTLRRLTLLSVRGSWLLIPDAFTIRALRALSRFVGTLHLCNAKAVTAVPENSLDLCKELG